MRELTPWIVLFGLAIIGPWVVRGIFRVIKIVFFTSSSYDVPPPPPPKYIIDKSKATPEAMQKLREGAEQLEEMMNDMQRKVQVRQLVSAANRSACLCCGAPITDSYCEYCGADNLTGLL